MSEEKLVTQIIAEYLKEEALLNEGWGDVAGSVASAASSQLQKKSIENQFKKAVANLAKVKGELSKCGDSKWCKVKKNVRIVALTNHINDLKRKRRR